MKKRMLTAIATACVAVSIGVVIAKNEPGMELIRGKPAHDAGLAALSEAEKLAGSGSWELIAVGRVYYLSGDKAKGQALFDKVTAGKPEASDWKRLGFVYAEVGDKTRAEDCFQKALAKDPKDDSGQAEIGAWYIRDGQREKGEELLAKALAKNPGEIWHYVRAAEALLGVPPGG